MKNNRTLKNGSKQILILVLLLITTVSFAQTGNVNFSGSWKLDEGKSQTGEGRMRMGASALTVKQNGNNLSVERTSASRDGSTGTTSEKYTLDGRANSNTGMMNRPVTSTVSWTGNGRTLTFQSSQTFERDGQRSEIKSSEIWSLSPDAKTLIIDITSSGRQGETKRKLVYTK